MRPPSDTAESARATSVTPLPQPDPAQAVPVEPEAISPQAGQVAGTSEGSVPVTPTDDEHRSDLPSDHDRWRPDRKGAGGPGPRG